MLRAIFYIKGIIELGKWVLDFQKRDYGVPDWLLGIAIGATKKGSLGDPNIHCFIT